MACIQAGAGGAMGRGNIPLYTRGESLGGNMEQQLAKYSNAVPVMFANGKYLLANHLQDHQRNQLLTNIVVAILLNFIQL